MASLKLTDKLAIGCGPVITAGTPSFDPAFFAPVRRARWGFRHFQRRPTPDRTGAPDSRSGYSTNSTTTGTWDSRTRARSGRRNGNSTPRPRRWPRARIGIQASLPEMISWGIAYKGLPKTLIDVDLRYIDYANSSLFGTKVVDGGLGWQSVFAVALGAQYQATDRLTLRGGYLYNTNPIRAVTTLFNAQRRDHPEHAHPWCIVPGDRKRHCFVRLDARLPQRDREPDRPDPGYFGPTRCTARHALGRREHQVRRFEAKGPRGRDELEPRTTLCRRRIGAILSCRRHPTRTQSRARRPIRLEAPARRRRASRLLTSPCPRHPERFSAGKIGSCRIVASASLPRRRISTSSQNWPGSVLCCRLRSDSTY